MPLNRHFSVALFVTGLLLPGAAGASELPSLVNAPPPVYESGDVASPGEPFLPGTATRGDKVFAVEPKLACSFTVLGDGTVLIVWTNEGNGPVPTGTLIWAHSPQYNSQGLWTPKPLMPGESFSVSIKSDPKLWDGPCTATINA